MADEPRKSLFETQRDFVRQQAEVSPFAANWPARTWMPGERVTSGMMNGVRDQLNELHNTVGGLDATNVAYKNQANVFTVNQVLNNAALFIQGSNPSLYLYDPTQPVNLRNFRLMNQTQLLRIYAQDDGESGFVNAMSLSRSGQLMVRGTIQIGKADIISPTVPGLRNTDNRLDIVLGDQTNWAPVQALSYYAVGVGNSFADLTVRGATNFQSNISVSNGAVISQGPVYPGFVDTGAAQVSYYIGAHTGYAGLYTNASLTAQGELYAIGNIFSNSPVYPGRIDTGWTKQTSLYLGSHGSYGLYSNTGLYLEGPVWMSSFASRGPGTIAGNLTITTGGASITGTLVVNTVVVNVGPLTVATGGADITGYSYVRTPGGAGDASLFLMNPAAGGATQNFRLMSYGGYFRVWNADNGAELLLVHGSGSVTLPGGGGVMSAQVYYERGRTVPMGGLTAVDPAVYMHGQVVGVSGTMMYALVGRMMHLTFNIAATCVTGGGNQINMTIPFPAGQLPAITCHVGIWTAHAQRYWHSSFAAYAANQYFLTFYDEGLAGWPDGAIYLYGSIDIPFSP